MKLSYDFNEGLCIMRENKKKKERERKKKENLYNLKFLKKT